MCNSTVHLSSHVYRYLNDEVRLDPYGLMSAFDVGRPMFAIRPRRGKKTKKDPKFEVSFGRQPLLLSSAPSGDRKLWMKW